MTLASRLIWSASISNSFFFKSQHFFFRIKPIIFLSEYVGPGHRVQMLETVNPFLTAGTFAKVRDKNADGTYNLVDKTNLLVAAKVPRSSFAPADVIFCVFEKLVISEIEVGRVFLREFFFLLHQRCTKDVRPS